MLATRYIAHGEIFKNMLQLKRLCLYFERIVNNKRLISYRNNDISYRDARDSETCSRRKFLKYLVQSGPF